MTVVGSHGAAAYMAQPPSSRAGTNSTAPILGHTTPSEYHERSRAASILAAASQPQSRANSRPGSRSASLARLFPPTIRDQDASILLLGIRGTGKTSLALLAASCINFRLVDADQHFYQATGMSRAAYLTRCGLDVYRRHELDLMRSLLKENPTRSIIVCGPGSTEGTGQQLLLDLCKSHPIIHVMRDPADVARYLRTADVAHVAKLTELASSSYRAASNYEFYNLSEPVDHDTQLSTSAAQLQSHPYLVLKDVEQDFLRLVHSIRCQSARPGILQARNVLSFIPPEAKHFTYALVVPLQTIPDVALRLRGTDLSVDAVEIVIELEDLFAGRQSFDESAASWITKDYYSLRRNVRLPVILHVALSDAWLRSASSGINAHHMWSTYIQVLSHALRLSPDYLTLDLRCEPVAARSLISNKVSTKIIGHFYDSNPTDGGWDGPSRMQLLTTAAEWDCDLVRLCQYAESRNDNAAVHSFVHRATRFNNAGIPIIAYNLGPLGRQSCFNNSILTPVTHQLVEEAMRNARPQQMPSLLTLQQAQDALYSSFALDRLVFGIFGSAVASTMSPPMHNAAFAFCKMPHVYEIYQSTSLSDLGPIVQNPQFGGASISAPFKKEIFSVLHHVSPEAQAIGAVNTIVPLRSETLDSLVDRNKSGPVVALFGDNTDWIGLHTCVRRNLSPVNAANSRKTALILGAGGMAQAAVYAAVRLGVHTIFVYNRTLSRAEQLVKQFNGKTFALPRNNSWRASPNSSPPQAGASTASRDRLEPITVRAIRSMDEPWPADFEAPTIIMSCIARTTVDGETQAGITLPEAWLSSPTGGVVAELAYDPLETPLLKQVRALRARGWIAVHGLDVLPEQAYAQFELFTGRPAPQKLMEAQILEHLRHSH